MDLQLSLKKPWFRMTESGVKTEDYRDITEHWIKRLFYFKMFPEDWGINDIIREFTYHGDELDFINKYGKKFKTNIMTLGYPKSTDKDRILKYKHEGIEIREGNEKWGAVPGVQYFVIKHGEKDLTKIKKP